MPTDGEVGVFSKKNLLRTVPRSAPQKGEIGVPWGIRTPVIVVKGLKGSFDRGWFVDSINT